MKKIVFFSGAGISAESGISTFRDSNGLWENYAIEEVATPEAWKKNPALVQSFYNDRRKNVLGSEPNGAHLLISQLEDRFNVTVITQNIDDLHERAGSSAVFHLHGNIRLAKSSGPKSESAYYEIKGTELNVEKDFCDDHFPLRPHVVWFGEAVPMFEQVIPFIQQADVFVVIGTSLNVYPAAGLINYCNAKAKKFVIDTKSNELGELSGFIYINETAVKGMQELLTQL
jgi:NAD-dependent deacetylase